MAKRNLKSSKLMGSDLLIDSEDDPMSSLANLMDVMLVFACGLIIALIAKWNVDISQSDFTEMNTSVTELQGELEAIENGISEGMEGYENIGDVYRDEETGQLYVVER